MNDTSEPVPQSQVHSDKALDDLRSEYVVLRRGIEDWQKHIEKNLPPNYSDHFTLLAKGIEEVADKADDLGNKIDAIQSVPRQAMNTVVEEGRKMFDELKTKMTYAASLSGKERDALKSLVGSAQTQKQQREWLMWAGAGGVATGMVLFFVLAYIAPFGLDGYIAAGIMGKDRWNAGQTLMQSANPGGWHLFTQDANLTNANRSKVDACRAAAAKSKKDESCTISVPPGG